MNVMAHQLRAQLPDIADQLQAKLGSLFDDPCADKCDRIQASLQGVMVHIAMLRAELLTPEQPTV